MIEILLINLGIELFLLITHDFGPGKYWEGMYISGNGQIAVCSAWLIQQPEVQRQIEACQKYLLKNSNS